MFRKFLKEERGNVAMLFGLAAVPVIFAVGAGVDVSRVVSVKQRAQMAVDSAALAVNSQSYANVQGDIGTIAQSVFEANFDASSGSLAAFSATKSADGVINVTAKVGVDTAFSPLVGVDQMSVSVYSETKINQAIMDVVLVLDNSGSMRGTKIETLKSAATDLAKTLFAVNVNGGKRDRVKIGVVPFTAFVNVGFRNDTAPWMDTNALSPLHSNNFASNVNRFDLFKSLNGVSWEGCVEARPYPHDVLDTPATVGDPQTLFVPQFAPDEPSWDYRFSKSVYNDWLDDDGGICTAADAEPGTYKEAQERICKYERGRPNITANGILSGPNYGCKTIEVQPLTETQGQVVSNIARMKADGYTNIHQGTVWGWRALSAQEPFIGGREPEDNPGEGYRRIMILMTDGANTYEWLGSSSQYPNISKYNAYGYVTEGRTGVTTNDYSAVTDEMDSRTLETCTNAKETDDVLIYTVAFQVSDTATRNMLRDCASSPSMAYKSDTNNELTLAFAEIAKEISKLRLSR